MLRYTICTVWLLIAPAAFAQLEFYSATTTGELIRSNTVSCASHSLGTFGIFQDIAITPNGTLYGLNETVYRLDPATGNMQPIGVPLNAAGMFSAGTGLAALDDAHLISDRFDSLFVIDLANGSASPLGKTGFFCMGDMAFHEGYLYMVSETNNLIRIELDPVTHLITGVSDRGQIVTASHLIFSLFSTFETCTSGKPSLFAIDGLEVYRIDPENAQTALVCGLGTEDFSYGGAAIGTLPPVMPEYVLPNVFTPNGDGINDVFAIDPAITVLSFRVTNRWGATVYSRGPGPVHWDGTVSGEQLTEGVYFYAAEIERCGTAEELHGFLSLVR